MIKEEVLEKVNKLFPMLKEEVMLGYTLATFEEEVLKVIDEKIEEYNKSNSNEAKKRSVLKEIKLRISGDKRK